MHNKSLENLYKQKRHQTEDKKQILILLYEKVVLLLEESIEKMTDYKNYDDINENLKKVNEILEELKKSIDLTQGEISEQLNQLYTFLIEQVTEANMEKSNDKLKEVKKIVDDLLIAWRKASSKIKSSLALKNSNIGSLSKKFSNNSGLKISI